MERKIRSVFISDVHLGCKYARAEDLLEFLDNLPNKPQYLYLVGDIIDGWRMKSRGIYWTKKYTDVVRKILKWSRKHKTIVRYAIGNHDEVLRNFIDENSVIEGNIELSNEFIHETADGRRLLVIHGDEFDHFTKHWTWLSKIADGAYNFALWLNKQYNAIRRRLGWKYWSLSAVLKTKVKEAAKYINNFEQLLSKHTKMRECKGVVCGHIHVPVIKEMDGIMYHNCGDWVEHCTGIIEWENGELELVHHHDSGVIGTSPKD
jgi:UDP-2,3-diacylglucosamine pyrophosphatase LpxH